MKKPHNAGGNVPNDKRSDPCMHGRCVEAEALSKGAEKSNVTIVILMAMLARQEEDLEKQMEINPLINI